ncbi:hypothetical protein HID58_085708 [Brassica napus]|uniref:NB-ARC domain-containing protein n=1 Tax=Brassica napus TaxID=3708 RepID=A0ABQ7XNF4_BRANA|nr:hypothetical protein HID58_085708 [Brassica napus]
MKRGAEKHLLDSSTISLAYEKQYNLRCLVGEKGLVISCIKGESLPENCSLGSFYSLKRLGLISHEDSYIHNLEDNLSALETTMEDLKARRDDLSRRVDREENNGLRRRAQVQVWLTRVETIESQVQDLFSKPIQPTIIGRETMLETVWNHLMEDGVGIMGLYGMGGVGKTTLLKQNNNKFLENEDDFDIVIWIVVSKDLQIQNIQEEVATKLGLAGEDWILKNEDQKACEVHNVLRRKKFLLLLDDIWTKVDLTEIGVPYPSRKNGRKVVFTNRSQEVCGRMGVDVEMEVQCLQFQDAFDLFKTKLLCHGLPLALNVIGEAMASKRTIQEWQHAIDVLTSYAAEFSGMEDEILSILKYSYDNLKSEHVKSCLLYCALFPEDHRISKHGLVEYMICEGIIDGSESMERAQNKGYEIIGSLIRASLLMEDEKKALREVFMHDVVREMALWIASDFRKHKDNFIVRACVGLQELPRVKNWNVVKRMSLMSNKIGRVSGSDGCLELTTLFLQKNKKSLVSISGEFFRFMPRLVVLDLSYNINLSELPGEISELVSLKYLNMSFTGIQCLPVGFLELKNLIHLDLEDTSELSSIVGISALVNLKSQHTGGVTSLGTIRNLNHMNHLWFSSRSVFQLSQALAVKSCQLKSSNISLLSSMEKVHELLLDGCTFSEIKMDVPENACFMNLSRITLQHCECVRDLTWMMFASNLTVLFICDVKEVEGIISKEKVYVGEESSDIVPFQKLRTLPENNVLEFSAISLSYENCGIQLSKAEKTSQVKGESHASVVRSHIDYHKIFSCNWSLHEFSLIRSAAQVVKGDCHKVWREKEWLEGVEWEDEATKARFLPSCIQQVVKGDCHKVWREKEWLEGVEWEDEATKARFLPSCIQQN